LIMCIEYAKSVPQLILRQNVIPKLYK